MFYTFKEYLDEFGCKIQLRFEKPTNSVQTAKAYLRRAVSGEVRDEHNRLLAVRTGDSERWVRDFATNLQ